MRHRDIALSIALAALAAAGCDRLGPLTEDDYLDAPPAEEPELHILPPGSAVPAITEDAELSSQIRIYDGLSDSALEMAGGVITRSDGKAAGVDVKYWSFGAARMEGSFAVTAPVYVLADDDGAGVLTPRTDHPWLVDSIPGDPSYSAVRRIFLVPVSAGYAGELLTSTDALREAIELGLVGEPQPAGTWQNMPIVPSGTRLELGGTAEPLAATEVYGRAYRIELFPLGGAAGVQPLRTNNTVPVGQESRLLSGVVGADGTLPSSPDAKPVFQYGIPAALPEPGVFNYTPLVTQLDVRLADTVAPTAILDDAQLFRRSASGSISGFYVAAVASYTTTTSVTNKQIQFAEGAP
jgi:hypothetical protein